MGRFRLAVLGEFFKEPQTGQLSMARLLALLWGIAAVLAMWFADHLYAAEAFAGALTALGLRKGN